jgi:hypothetical protein
LLRQIIRGICLSAFDQIFMDGWYYLYFGHGWKKRVQNWYYL